MTMKSALASAILSLLVPAIGFSQQLANQSNAVPEPRAPKMFDIGAIDKSVDPCRNFYQFACGNWRKANPIPSDQSAWSRLSELSERSRWLTYQILETATKPSHARTPLQQKYGDFFAACMDVDRTNEQGRKPIQAALDRIAALTDRSQIPALVGNLQSKKATNVLFRFSSTEDTKNSQEEIAELAQDGLGLPDRHYYVDDDDRSKRIRTEYVKHVTNVFKLLGDSAESAAKEADQVMKFETGLAIVSQTRIAMQNPENTYHRMTVSKIADLAPGFDWSKFFRAANAPPLTNNINVTTPDFLKRVGDEAEHTDLAVWRSYLRWQVVHAAAPWLSDNFVDENFNFYGKTLTGQEVQQGRWKRCTSLTDSMLGEAVGQDWVKQNFPLDSEAKMEKLVASVEMGLKEDIQQLDWMSPATEQQAELKLAAMRNKIGHPTEWRDYSSVTIVRDNLIEDIDHASTFEYHRKLMKIGKPVDVKEWGMPPQTVNGYYDASMNEFIFPAGFLQPPFFSADANIAQNLGGIGVVIGHEITHGFDNIGGKYDANGNLREWYTPEDRKAFEQRTDCEVNEYGGFETVKGQTLNGKLTLSENTADNGALRIAYIALMDTLKQNPKAAQDVDGYTPAQQYFISFGQILCENRTDAVARLGAQTDPHSPGEFRVNGVVQNFDAFGKAFGCNVGVPMMPKNSCRVW
jgi:putative endopeptidase